MDATITSKTHTHTFSLTHVNIELKWTKDKKRTLGQPDFGAPFPWKEKEGIVGEGPQESVCLTGVEHFKILFIIWSISSKDLTKLLAQKSSVL